MKNKIIILTMFFSSITYSGLAQFNEKQNEHKWGMTVSVNDANSQMAYYGEVGLAMDAEGNMISAGKKINHSFSLSFTPKYYINNQWLLRFEYGLTQIDLTNMSIAYSSPTPSFNSTTTNDAIKQKINRYVAGAQFIFFKNKRIESYGGVSLDYIKYAVITRNVYSEQHDVVTDTLISWGRSNITIPGGYAVGSSVFGGFNVFLYNHISLGAEFSSSLLYYNVGGEYSELYSYQNKPSPPLVLTNTISNDSYKGTRFTKVLTLLNIAFWL
jgi:hypothetical protein